MIAAHHSMPGLLIVGLILVLTSPVGLWLSVREVRGHRAADRRAQSNADEEALSFVRLAETTEVGRAFGFGGLVLVGIGMIWAYPPGVSHIANTFAVVGVLAVVGSLWRNTLVALGHRLWLAKEPPAGEPTPPP